MRTLRAGLCLTLLVSADAVGGQELRVDVALRSDRAEYFVGEAVRLELAVANRGDGPIHGFVVLDPSKPPAWRTDTLLHCVKGVCEPFVLTSPIEAIVDRIYPVAELAGGREQTSGFVVSWDEKRSGPVLASPGEHEFRWVTTGLFPGPGRRWDRRTRGVETTASVVVTVVPVPKSEETAYEKFVSLSLARVAQYNPMYSSVDPAAASTLLQFLRDFPDSIYSRTLRWGATGFLGREIRAGRLTEEQKALAEQYVGAAVAEREQRIPR